MRRSILLIGLCMLSASVLAQSLKRFVINEQSVVKDTAGTVYPYSVWSRLSATGDYILQAEDPANDHTTFLLIHLSAEEKQRRAANAPKPSPSPYFRTGEKISSFKAADLEGKKYNLKDLAGKIVVINFWFIDCLPCRREIPELNKLVNEYKDSSNIVFLAIALDDRSSLRNFLKKMPFDYHVIDGGRYIATQYGVKTFPTHLVLDTSGKVAFHATGFGAGSVPWLRKTIQQLQEPAAIENNN